MIVLFKCVVSVNAIDVCCWDFAEKLMSVKRSIVFCLCHGDENNSGNKARCLKSVIQKKKKSEISIILQTLPHLSSSSRCFVLSQPICAH